MKLLVVQRLSVHQAWTKTSPIFICLLTNTASHWEIEKEQENKQTKHKTSGFHIYTFSIIHLNAEVTAAVPSPLQSGVVMLLENGCWSRRVAWALPKQDSIKARGACRNGIGEHWTEAEDRPCSSVRKCDARESLTTSYMQMSSDVSFPYKVPDQPLKAFSDSLRGLPAVPEGDVY